MGHDAQALSEDQQLSQRLRSGIRMQIQRRPTLDLSQVHGEGIKRNDPFRGFTNRPVPPDKFTEEYELGGALGSGSVAVVMRATKRVDGHGFAIKCVAVEEEEHRMFAMEEFDLMRTLSHESILGVEALFDSGTHLFMVLELCETNLQAWVERHGASEEHIACDLFRQLLSAVHYLHGKRIVHRDLKPENLLLTDGSKTLKIADFNSAKRIGDGPGASVMLSARGTHHFSAPELLFGKLWNERVDIWACGLVLYFMLQGHLPFNCTKAGVKASLAAGTLPEVSWFGVSQLLRNLIEQCLAVDMRDRPPAMELIHHEIFTVCQSPVDRGHSLSMDSKLSFLSLSTTAVEDAGAKPQSKDGQQLKQLQRNKLVRSMPPSHAPSPPLPPTGLAATASSVENQLADGTPKVDSNLFFTWAGPSFERPFSFDQ